MPFLIDFSVDPPRIGVFRGASSLKHRYLQPHTPTSSSKSAKKKYSIVNASGKVQSYFPGRGTDVLVLIYSRSSCLIQSSHPCQIQCSSEISDFVNFELHWLEIPSHASPSSRSRTKNLTTTCSHLELSSASPCQGQNYRSFRE